MYTLYMENFLRRDSGDSLAARLKPQFILNAFYIGRHASSEVHSVATVNAWLSIVCCRTGQSPPQRDIRVAALTLSAPLQLMDLDSWCLPMARVLLGSPDTFHSICMQAAQQDNAQGGDRPDQVIGELVGQMSSLFDSAGYNAAGVLRRRLWSVALLTLLPSLNRDVLVHMDQVVNICVDVLTEERNGNGKDLGETLTRIVKGEDDSNGEGEVIQSSHTPLPPLLEARLKQELQGDVAGTMDMRSTVRQSMERLRSTIGDSMWEEVMGSVEPVVLVQLQGMVA
ncbi:unnamed protein product [Choristocarpus tenellus]